MKEFKPKRTGWRHVILAVTAGLMTIGFAGTGQLGVVAAPAGATPPCADVAILGVPGSNQGRSFHPDSTADEDLYGPEVWQAVQQVSTDLQGSRSVSAQPLDYPAVLDENALDVIVNYNKSQYKPSKDAGYSAAYDTLAQWASSPCGDDQKFVLIGYSQGAHIAGDLAQTILHSSKPVSADRLAGVLLMGDPAFNEHSPGAYSLDYMVPIDGSSPWVSLTDSEDAKSQGSLGKRAEFGSDDPVVSVCINGDVICQTLAANAADQDQTTKVHTAYKSAPFQTTGKTVATWAGALVADVIASS
ncbi:hypothetical protein CYJ73_24975 [Gordonia terrae]|uniref:Cutinase n=1 Tax=Gordonia terrae TaxID=2055 RepID=A0A2I1R122_9ACTN|nr:cutinase family protein [Gordonia terrae]PKZ62830.1 hypothetical protein CYJ73_24975 [Gordonia terrae]